MSPGYANIVVLLFAHQRGRNRIYLLPYPAQIERTTIIHMTSVLHASGTAVMEFLSVFEPGRNNKFEVRSAKVFGRNYSAASLLRQTFDGSCETALF